MALHNDVPREDGWTARSLSHLENPGSTEHGLRRVHLLLVALLLLTGCRGTHADSEKPTSVPGRAADSTVTVDQVKVELWASEQSVEVGRPLTATGRVTNMSPRAIWYEGTPCAQLLNGLVRFPAFDSVGRRQGGVAGRVKNAWIHGDGSALDRYTRPAVNSFFGTRDSNCNHDEEQAPPVTQLRPGKSLALTVVGAPEWGLGAFPSGMATLGVIFSFSPSEQSGGAAARVAYASVPVRVSGGSPTVSPAAALDAAFAADGVPEYLTTHADATQLTADPRLSPAEWIVSIQAIDASPAHKTVAPALEIAVDRVTGRVLSVKAPG
jgi:hypothetical protein